MIYRYINVSYIKLLRFLLVLMWAFTCNAFAQNEAQATATETLAAILSQSYSMQADVKQLTLDQGGYELQQLQARLIMKKPDHFYWELISPYEELTVTNGSKVWIYEPDLDQVTIQTFDPDPNSTPVLLLNGDADSLAASYEISQSLLPGENRSRFSLLPKDPGSLILSLSLTFHEGVLEELQYENSIGAQTSLSFSNVEIDQEIDLKLFSFDPPQGIDVIDTTQN